MKDLRQEAFYVACLTPSKAVICTTRISLGGATSTVVDPSEVIKTAILNDAHSVILIHNHPSGNPKPSQADIKLTRRIKDGAQLLGVGVDDHIIIAGNRFTSMSSERLL
jgi:DNA repair protein RadC